MPFRLSYRLLLFSFPSIVELFEAAVLSDCRALPFDPGFRSLTRKLPRGNSTPSLSPPLGPSPFLQIFFSRNVLIDKVPSPLTSCSRCAKTSAPNFSAFLLRARRESPRFVIPFPPGAPSVALRPISSSPPCSPPPRAFLFLR